MNATIERMRQHKADDEAKVTVSQVRGVVDGLIACRSLDEIAGTTKLEPSKVLDIVATFGTWLTHVLGGSGADTTTASDLAQAPLFQFPCAKATKKTKAAAKVKATAKKAATKAATKATKKVAPTGASIQVVIPAGFERSAWHKRDVSKALASIVVANPDNELITRYIARQYPTSSKVLTFEMVAVIWRFATVGRLDEIDQVNPDSAAFTRLVVAAYDLLEVARRDAIAGIRLLASADTSDIDALRQACTKARWVAEGEIAKIESLVAAVASRPSAETVLVKELKFLARRIEANPSRYLIGSIAELMDGQVRRIGAAAGLQVEGANRSDEVQIRRQLQDMGLSSDVDRLVPDGLKALQAGIIDTFWDAMERRVDGDPAWDEDLADSFDAVAS